METLQASVRGSCRSLVLTAVLFPTAYIHHTDPAYQWIRTWLATDQAAQAQIRDFQLFTEERRSVRKRAGAITVKEHNATWTAKDIIGQVMPSYREWRV